MSHLKCIVQMVKLLVWVIDSLVTGLHWRRLASCVNPGNSFLLRCNFSICLFMTSNFRCQTVEDAQSFNSIVVLGKNSSRFNPLTR